MTREDLLEYEVLECEHLVAYHKALHIRAMMRLDLHRLEHSAIPRNRLAARILYARIARLKRLIAETDARIAKIEGA